MQLLRALGAEDLPAYKALYDAMLAAHPLAFTSDAETERVKPPQHHLRRLGLDRPEGGQFVLGVFVGGELAGAVGCERDPRLKARHIGRVTAMMVRDDAQGRGIGRALLEACIERARAAGIERLTINVTASNLRALHLYEHAGFRRYGTLQRALKIGGRYHDKHHLALDL